MGSLPLYCMDPSQTLGGSMQAQSSLPFPLSGHTGCLDAFSASGPMEELTSCDLRRCRIACASLQAAPAQAKPPPSTPGAAATPQPEPSQAQAAQP